MIFQNDSKFTEIKGMAAFINRKKSLLIFSCALGTAALIVILLQYLLSGPKLGPYYDFLMSRRNPPEISRELLLIDTDEALEPGAAAQVILTLTEMDAAALVIETPVLGAAAGRIRSEDEIRSRFDEEFTLLGRNIRNLFEAIRVGSVPPQESEKYVGELVELSLRGKDRLTSALVHQDEAGMILMEQAAAGFGKVWKAGDLRPPLGLNAPGIMDSPWYSKFSPDQDGKLRRMSPMLPIGPISIGPMLPISAVLAAEADSIGDAGTEHVIYAALKSRFSASGLEYSKSAQVLISHGAGGEEIIIPLDKTGAILFERPGIGAEFRRLPLDIFLKYEETDHALQRLLREADGLGIYSQLEPENSPVYLFEYAQSLREDFLETPPSAPSKKADWVHARSEYFAGLEAFLSGPAEVDLVAGYEELIAAETLGEAGLARITGLRDELGLSFAAIRKSYGELRNLRLSLKEMLDASFVILGPGPSGGASGDGALSRSEASAVLANTILSGRAIDPGQGRQILFWSLLASVLCLLIIIRLRPPAALITGLVLSLLTGAAFSWSFIISAYWIDPFIPVSAMLAETLLVFSLFQGIIRRGARRFQLAYGPYVSKACLNQLLRIGRPLPSELISARAAIIAVRKQGLLSQEDRGNSLAGAAAAAAFRERVSRLFKKAGGVIIGCDGDLVLGCFGSPLERAASGGIKADPYARSPSILAVRASNFIADVMAGTAAAPDKAETAAWTFGIDIGECSFRYLPVSGYSAFGRPVVRARILSGLAPRYKVQVVVSALVSESLSNMPVRRLNVLKEQDGSEGEAFFQLVMK
ncbi:hypothetical protein FACS189485_03350 [Spirochaetia bacterium]|nr:hypothetical protein FACS189485_03350 [Spirochaetia bacterium]